jgi:hypothetical protein
MSNDPLREYFLKRKKESEAQLAAARKLGFRPWRSPLPAMWTVTAEHIRRLEKTIEDYQEAADILAPR